MTNKIEYQITINQEGLITSIVKDVSSIGIICFAFWFNYNFIGGSYIVNFLILSILMFYLVKLAKDNCRQASWYFKVSPEKIEEIKKILETKKEGK
ncbi:MAG: hypothetical protein FJ368_03185 [Pelagibacterales bacterium]|nr:hypothetical protein [Pelagibacterales bacterium]